MLNLLFVMGLVAIAANVSLLLLLQYWISSSARSFDEIRVELRDIRSWHDELAHQVDWDGKRLKNEVQAIADRINQCEVKVVRASEEIALGHADQAKLAHCLMTDLQRVFGKLAAEYKPGCSPKLKPMDRVVDFTGFDKLADVEKSLKNEPKNPANVVTSVLKG